MAASASFGSSHAYTEKVWRRAIEHQVERQTVGMSLVSKDPNATILLLDELSKSRGDTVQLKFSPTADSDGIGEGDGVFANAGRIDFYNDELKIDYLGKSFALDSPMSQQRTSVNLKKVIFQKQEAWWVRRLEQWIMNQLGGNTAANTASSSGPAYQYGGMNVITAIDSNHIIYPKTTTTTPALVAADATAIGNLGIIDDFLVNAMSSTYLSYPIAPGPDGYYDCIVHPLTWRHMRETATAGDWQNIQLEQIAGGKKYESTGIAKGPLGIYGNTRIHVSDYVPRALTAGAAQANTRLMIFCGRHAGGFVFGEGYAEDYHLDWSEEVFEHKKFSSLVDTVSGFKRIIYNSETYGVLVCPVYVPA